MEPMESRMSSGFVERRVAERRRSSEPGSSWRSGTEMLGYALWATDGPMGEIVDFSCEAESLCVTEIIAVARRFFMSERFCVPLSAVAGVDALQRRVDVRLTRAEIRRLSRAAAS
jgi:hypothetical protein